MDVTVEASLIALLGVVVATIASLAITAWGNRRERENELVVAALTHLVGGSQERTAGLAALTILSGSNPYPHTESNAAAPHSRRSRRAQRHWGRYAPAVGQLIYAQLMYLLLHASNRHKAHEIANIIAMADWLLRDGSFRFEHARQRAHLRRAMDSYVKVKPFLKREGEGFSDDDTDASSVYLLQNLISDVWLGQLGPPQENRWFEAPGTAPTLPNVEA